MKTKSVDLFFKKLMKNKEFRKEYDRVGPIMQIAITIAEAREKAGLSQTQLALRLKTTQSVVSRIENGNQNLSLQMLYRIAEVLGCHLSIGLEPIHKKAA